MDLINTFKIAWRNLKRRRKAALSLGCGVLIITMLVTVWAVFHEGINRIYDDVLSGISQSMRTVRLFWRRIIVRSGALSGMMPAATDLYAVQSANLSTSWTARRTCRSS